MTYEVIRKGTMQLVDRRKVIDKVEISSVVRNELRRKWNPKKHRFETREGR